MCIVTYMIIVSSHDIEYKYLYLTIIWWRYLNSGKRDADEWHSLLI